MADADERIRAAMEQLADQAELVAAPPKRRSLMTAAVAMVATIALIGGAAAFVTRDRGGPANVVASDAPEATTTTTLPQGWQRVDVGPPHAVHSYAALDGVLFGVDHQDQNPPLIWKHGAGWKTPLNGPFSDYRDAYVAPLAHEFFVWNKGQAAVLDADRLTWRTLPTAPNITVGRTPVALLWTGREVLVWGDLRRPSPSSDGVAWNPTTDKWREIAAAPAAINAGGYTWTGSELVVIGAQLDYGNGALAPTVAMAYKPSTNRWRLLPPPGLSPQSSDIVWTGRQLIAWDYLLGAKALTPGANRWAALPQLPLQPRECYAQSQMLHGMLFAVYCDQLARFDESANEWERIASPLPERDGVTLGDGADLFAVAGIGSDGALLEYTPEG